MFVWKRIKGEALDGLNEVRYSNIAVKNGLLVFGRCCCIKLFAIHPQFDKKAQNTDGVQIQDNNTIIEFTHIMKYRP